MGACAPGLRPEVPCVAGRPRGAPDLGPAPEHLSIDGEQVELTARAYALLEYLALRAGQVVTREDIREHIYDATTTAAGNVVDVYIGYLRKELDRPGLPPLIETRRGAGYLMTSRGGEDGAPTCEPSFGAARSPPSWRTAPSARTSSFRRV